MWFLMSFICLICAITFGIRNEWELAYFAMAVSIIDLCVGLFNAEHQD